MSRKVRIPKGYMWDATTPEAVVEIGEDGGVVWNGSRIGRVWKGTRTYSPPLYPGSRIAKYHKQVPEWHGATMKANDGTIREDTRQRVIQMLIREAMKEEV